VFIIIKNIGLFPVIMYTFQIRAKTDNPIYTIGPTDALMVKCVYPILFTKDMFRPLSRSASG